MSSQRPTPEGKENISIPLNLACRKLAIIDRYTVKERRALEQRDKTEQTFGGFESCSGACGVQRKKHKIIYFIDRRRCPMEINYGS